MAILKSYRSEDPFTRIKNQIAQDTTMSYEARGLLVELLSRPPKWEIHRKQLLRDSCADEKLKRIMDELRQRGYLYLHDDSVPGSFQAIWIVSDTPRTEEEYKELISHTENPDGRTSQQSVSHTENPDGHIIGSTKKELREESSTLQVDPPQSVGILPRRVSNKDYDHQSAPYLLADALLNLIEKGPNPNTYARYTKSAEGREGVIQNLAYSFDMVLRVDGRPINEVMDLLEWCQKDAFWKGNIRSGDSFRRGYKTMLTQMKERGFGTAPVPDDPNPVLTNEIIGVYRQLTNEPRFKPNADQLTKFIEASGKCERFFRRHQDVEQNQRMELLRSCMDKNYLNQSHVVFPGHLCSDNTWTILMPQYLAEAGYE